MNLKNTIFNFNNYIKEHQRVLELIDHKDLEDAVGMIGKAFRKGKKVITCGNGGSASTASHFITDWTKMINVETGEKFRGFSLVDNAGLVTAYGNDVAFSEIFSGQCKALLDQDDLLVVVSGSGNSDNVVNAIKEAKNQGAHTLGILGYDGGEAAKLADHSFIVPSFDMQICEDIHLMFGHMVMKKYCNLSIVGV